MDSGSGTAELPSAEHSEKPKKFASQARRQSHFLHFSGNNNMILSIRDKDSVMNTTLNERNSIGEEHHK